MKTIALMLTLLLACSTFAKSKKNHKHNHKHKQPIAKLSISQSKCDSPCTVTLDGSKSIAEKGKTISKYIFDLGNGETIESTTPSIEFTYINFKEETDKIKRKKRAEKYKKWKKYINHCKKRFKSFDKFEINLQVVQSDEKSSKSAKKTLLVKPSDSMPVIDGDDIIPETPNQALSDSTLLGIDSDEDGVRDDVELFINSEFPDSPEKRKLYKQFTRQTKAALEGADSKEESIKAAYLYGKVISCASALGDEAFFRAYIKNRKRLETLVLNTKLRIKRDILYNSQLGGAGTSPEVLEAEANNVDKTIFCK